MVPDIHDDEKKPGAGMPANEAPKPIKAIRPVQEKAKLSTVKDTDDSSSENTRSDQEGWPEEEIHDRDQQVADVEAASRSPSAAAPLYSVFSRQQKHFIVFMTAIAGFFSPLSASIYFPALNTLSREFNVSETLINLTLTTYMIFQGLAPTVFGDLADSAGRRPAYALGFIIYIGANIGLALQDSYAALLVLRCLQSTGSSATIALGSGVVADIATSSERGVYMGWATSGPMIAPALGPVLGGIFAQFLGWRSIFWFLVILTAVYIIPFLISFPETGRNVVGNGSIAPQGWNMSLLNYFEVQKAVRNDVALSRISTREQMRQAQEKLAKQRKFRWPNPLNTLHVVFEKDVGLLLLYNAIVYTAFYDVIASMPYFFQRIYGFNDLEVGLCFLPYGAGAFLAPMTSGRIIDWNYRRVAKKIGFTIDRKRGDDMKNFPLERVRIQVVWPFLLVGNLAILAYGWVLHTETSLAAPLVLQFLMGLFLTSAFNALSVMLIDFYPHSPATATAANNLVRCLLGAGGTGIIIEMIEALGSGWCFTLIAGVLFGLSPMLYVLMRWGPGWREERRLRVEKKEDS